MLAAAAPAAAATPLIDAVKAGDAAAVRAALQKRADVNAAEADGMTALHWAARNNDVAAARALVRAGASAKASTRYGVTPLTLAAQNGSASMLDLLLKAGADGQRDDAAGRDGADDRGAHRQRADAIKVLAAHGADVNVREGWMGESALMWAAAENHAESGARRCVELGADVNHRSKVLQFPEFKWTTSGMVSTALPRGGWTPLMHAARQGSLAARRRWSPRPEST